MSAGHTPGPIRTDEQDHDHPYQNILLLGAQGRRIATVWIDDAPVPEFNSEQAANARRLVACWNACEGIETPALEADNVTFAAMLRERAALRVQRDELLAALKSAKWMLERDHIDEQKMRVIERCDAAIAKVTKEQP